MRLRMKRVRGLWLVVAALVVGCGSNTDPTPVAPGLGAPADTAPKSVANGTLESWTTLDAMPTPRGNHCAAALKGWLVVVGGNYKPKGADAFKTVADVHAAKIDADGKLGPWILAGKTPSPVASCTAASDGNDLYLVDGIYEGEAETSVVRRATLDADGTLGTWQSLGSLPKGVRLIYSYASITDGSLRAFTAKLPDSGNGISLVRASIGSGELGAWEDTMWLTGFRGHPQYAVAQTKSGSFVYALGGYAGADKGNEVLADGAGARLDDRGAPGDSFKVSALPKPTAFGKAVAVDDWIFVVGGKDGVLDGKGRTDVFAAHVESDGTLGSWSSVAALPQGRTSLAVVLAGDFLYVLGGGYDAGGLDTVFSARVRFLP
jgi:hypothetical protein